MLTLRISDDDRELLRQHAKALGGASGSEVVRRLLRIVPPEVWKAPAPADAAEKAAAGLALLWVEEPRSDGPHAPVSYNSVPRRLREMLGDLRQDARLLRLALERCRPLSLDAAHRLRDVLEEVRGWIDDSINAVGRKHLEHAEQEASTP